MQHSSRSTSCMPVTKTAPVTKPGGPLRVRNNFAPFVPGRSRLVAERQSLVFAREFAYKLPRRSRGVLNLAEKPNLAHATGVRNRNCIAGLRAIEGYESFAMIAHDSPSLLEALPGLS